MRERLVRVVTNRLRFDALYGEGYFGNLRKTFENWKKALAADGLVVEEPFVLCDELPDAGASPALKEQLARLNRKPADAVVILGGPAVVPFYPIRSAEFLISGDGDAQVLSDDPYVAFDRHNVLNKPECPVGRLPDGGPGQPELLINLLSSSAQYHSSSAPVAFNPVGLTSRRWYDQSRGVFGFSGNSLYTSPPCALPTFSQPCADDKIPACLESRNLHYYNVCGTCSNTVWYGQCTLDECERKCDQPDVPVLDAPTIPALSGACVYSEASYGASISLPADANLALQFLKQGTLCYVGSTAMAYCGFASMSLQAADRMARMFINGLCGNELGHTQLSVGEILKRAKLGYPVHDNFDRKTLVEFTLFGDPTLVPFRR